MPLRKFKTDVQIREKFSLTSKKLDELKREKGFPHIPLAKGVNAYYTDSVIKWMLNHEINTPETEKNES